MALALDGNAHGVSHSATTVSCSITTSGTNRVLIAIIANDGAVSTFSEVDVSGVAGASLTWTLRKRYSNTGGTHTDHHTIEEWWAPAPSQLTSQTITATFASAPDAAGIIVFGVSGAYDYTNPFDTSAALPATFHDDSGTASEITGTFSTVSNDTFVFGAWGSVHNNTIGTSLTSIDSYVNSAGTDWCASGAAYTIESAAQSGTTLQFSSNGIQTAANWNYIIDAITGDAPAVKTRSFACQIG